MATDSIAFQTERLKEGLLWSKDTTASATAVLDSYVGHVGELDHMIQPVAQRVKALTAASEKIKAARAWADATLRYLDTTRLVEPTVQAGPRANLDEFVDSMQRLEKSIAFFEQNEGMVAAERAGAAARKLRLEGLQAAANDFWSHLCDYSTAPSAQRLAQQVFAKTEDGQTLPPEADIDIPPQRVINRLAKLAALMFGAGEAGCFKTFVEARRSVLERTLTGLGTEYSSKDDYARLVWPVLEKKMQAWILAIRVLVRCAVAESRLAAGVFQGDYAEAAFGEVVAKSLQNVAMFGEAIVHGRRAPEKVFGLLDCHENLDAMMPQLQDLLKGTRCEEQLSTYRMLNRRMQEETRATFEEFEASVDRDSARHMVPDGTVHPLTAYSLSFLKRLFTYESSISVLFLGGQSNPDSPASGASLRERGMAAAGDPALVRRMSAAIQRILDLLTSNLSTKAKAYKSKALAALFMMNNLHYMVKTVESSEALTVLGEEWIELHKDQVEEYGEKYQQEAWGPLLSVLQADVDDRARRDKAAIKERFRQVGVLVGAIEEVQAGWAIPDLVLRANLRDALAEDFLPLYEGMLQRNAASASRVTDKNIRYQVDDARAVIQGVLFEGRDAPLRKTKGAT